MTLFGSLIIFSLVIHMVISTDSCDKSGITPDDNGKFVFKPDDGSNTIPHDGSVTLQCTTAGHQPTDGAKQSHCHNGNWVETLSTCKPVKCLKHHLTSPPMDHGAYKFKDDSGVDAVENGTLATVECDKGYRLVKKTGGGDYKQTEFSDSDAFFCHYRVWVGRKAADLGYRCDPMGKVLLTGASQGGDGETIMELYDRQHPENNAEVTTHLDATRKAHVIGVFDDCKVAIAGGQKDGVGTKNTELYDPETGAISSVESQMNEIRIYAGSAMLNNEMIVCGGYDGTTNTLITCEKLFYDQPNGKYKWVPFDDMKQGRYSHAMTQFKGKLYVIGSFLTTAVEEYTNAWNIIKPMPSVVRPQLAVAGLGDFIYACGGGTGHAASVVVALCEKYDPERFGSVDGVARFGWVDSVARFGWVDSVARVARLIVWPGVARFTVLPGVARLSVARCGSVECCQVWLG